MDKSFIVLLHVSSGVSVTLRAHWDRHDRSLSRTFGPCMSPLLVGLSRRLFLCVRGVQVCETLFTSEDEEGVAGCQPCIFTLCGTLVFPKNDLRLAKVLKISTTRHSRPANKKKLYA